MDNLMIPLTTEETVILSPMTLLEAKQCVADIRSGLVSVGRKLLELYERDGWRALGYPSWRECAQVEFGYRSSYVYQLLESASIERNISTIGGNKWPIRERQLRPLTPLSPDEQREAWQHAIDTAPNGKVTAAHVQAVVDEMRGNGQPKAEMEDNENLRLMDGCHNCAFLQTHGEDWWCTSMERPTFPEFYACQMRYWKSEDELELAPAIAPMAVHFSSESPEWYTPPAILERTVELMHGIDLDPCSNNHDAPNVPALHHFTQVEDGLAQPWFGRVYMNPPYGREIADWIDKLCHEWDSGRIDEAVVLVPSRTDTEWFRRLRAFPRCFVWGRLHFSESEVGAPFPSMVVYLGDNLTEFVRSFGDIGDVYEAIR